MMTETQIKEEIERHNSLRNYELSAKNPMRAKLHQKIVETYEAVLLNDVVRIIGVDF